MSSGGVGSGSGLEIGVGDGIGAWAGVRLECGGLTFGVGFGVCAVQQFWRGEQGVGVDPALLDGFLLAAGAGAAVGVGDGLPAVAGAEVVEEVVSFFVGPAGAVVGPLGFAAGCFWVRLSGEPGDGAELALGGHVDDFALVVEDELVVVEFDAVGGDHQLGAGGGFWGGYEFCSEPGLGLVGHLVPLCGGFFWVVSSG